MSQATRSTQCQVRSRRNNLWRCHNYYRSAYSHFRYFLGSSQHYRRLWSNGPLIWSSSWTFLQSSWRSSRFFRKCCGAGGRQRHHRSQSWTWWGMWGELMVLPVRKTSHWPPTTRKIVSDTSLKRNFCCQWLPCATSDDLWRRDSWRVCEATTDLCSVCRSLGADKHRGAVEWEGKKVSDWLSSKQKLRLTVS